MACPRFFADHDLNDHIVVGLLRRAPTAEFVRSREVGLDREPDDQVLDYAAAHGLIVISHDVNTMPAAAAERIRAGKPTTGLLMVAQASPVGEVIDDLWLIWSASDAAEWDQRIEFLPL